MKETELQKRMLREVRQLLADLEGGMAPANPAVEAAVREQVLGQMGQAYTSELPDTNLLQPVYDTGIA